MFINIKIGLKLNVAQKAATPPSSDISGSPSKLVDPDV
jgi:hypothetical protein